MTVADKLADITLRDDAGTAVRLGDTWKEGTVVLTFIRHFG